MNVELAKLKSRGRLLAESEGLNVRVAQLEQGEQLPWVYHSELANWIFGMSGQVQISMVDPNYVFGLVPGELYHIAPTLRYSLANAGDEPAEYLWFQAGGKYDVISADLPDDRKPKTPNRFAVPLVRDREKIVTELDEDWGKYESGVVRIETLAKAHHLRLHIMELGANQCVPWHTHDHVSDTFFCMQGPMRVETREPRQSVVLLEGETFEVVKGQPHFVSGVGGAPTRCIIMQGVGFYTYNQLPSYDW